MAGPRPPRVLVVSDDSETASIVREVLSERGYAVGSVTNEQVSLDSLSVGRPDLVVLDMFAPLLDKWPILDELLRLREAPPLVALTGRSVSPGALAALAFHTRGHLSKPFTPAALLRICEKVIAAPPPPAPPAGAERRRETRCRFVGEATLLTENGRPSLTLQVLDVSTGGAKIEVGALLPTRLIPGAEFGMILSLLPKLQPATVRVRVQWRIEGIIGVSLSGHLPIPDSGQGPGGPPRRGHE